jgi:hypothetical protein
MELMLRVCDVGPADLKLPQRESERPFDLIGKARQHLQRVPFKVKFVD